MRASYRVEAIWDAEAQVWTSRSDVPGLVIETATLGEFEALMRDLIPELLADNGAPDAKVSVQWSAKGAFDLVAA